MLIRISKQLNLLDLRKISFIEFVNPIIEAFKTSVSLENLCSLGPLDKL